MQGYVTEAVGATLALLFEHLDAYRIDLECDDTNLRSRRVAERCGFGLVWHGHEDERPPDGTLGGTLHFELLRSEWLVPYRTHDPRSHEGGKDSE
jgi:RimJ/RimL family protein N-acetyltransferase